MSALKSYYNTAPLSTLQCKLVHDLLQMIVT